MRTTLILPTLFAVTLVSGAALADKPNAAIDRLRARGDVVDKSYRGVDRHTVAHGPQQASGGARPSFDRASSRVSCTDTGADCPTKHRDARAAAGFEASAGQTGRASRAPAFPDKVLGSDRTNFNEAGEAQGMSSRAAKRAWSHAAPGAAGGSAATSTPLAHQQQHARTEDQASSNRMAFNEAGEAQGMSSKAAKKQWAYEAVKKGTWQGPEAKKPSGAERAIAEMKKSETAKHHP